MIPDLYMWEEEDLVQDSLEKWEEAEHPRAKDGRFGSKPGQTVGGVIREKAKAMAPVIRNKEIAALARKHFTEAAEKLYNIARNTASDAQRDQLHDATRKFQDADGGDARNEFNTYVADIRPILLDVIGKKELDRTLLNIRNRYYQKLRAANLKEIPVEVDKPKEESGEYIPTNKLVDAFKNHPILKPMTDKIHEGYNHIMDLEAEKDQIYEEWDALTEKYVELKNKATSNDEVDRLIAEYQESIKPFREQSVDISDKIVTANIEVKKLRDEHGAACRKLLAIPEDQQSKFEINNFYGKKHDVDYEEEVQWLGTISNLHTDLGGGKDWATRMITINRNQRSYHHAGMVYLSRNAKKGVMVHEMGHCIEAMNKSVHRKCQEFLDKRTAGEVAKQIPGYGRGEMAKFDKFQDPYCGKIYKNATEILSMGLGFLYSNAAEFAENDPEYFEFVVDTLRGEPWK